MLSNNMSAKIKNTPTKLVKEKFNDYIMISNYIYVYFSLTKFSSLNFFLGYASNLRRGGIPCSSLCDILYHF